MGQVFIIDDDLSARRGLLRLVMALGHQATAYASAADFLAGGSGRESGCILLDVRMPGMDGPELQVRLAAEGCELPVIFLSAHGDIPTVAAVMKRGAVHFLTKPVDREDLAATLQEALESDRRRRVQEAGREAARGRVDVLTPREHEVMTHVISGRLNKQIAADLGVTEDTVKIHRSRMMQKAGVRSVAELVRLCDRLGIAAATSTHGA
jgi:FixJ family two-component response regulator